MEAGYLNELNEAQRLAVEQTDGPVMVIAGAGSGKTRVLTYRIAHLMHKGVDPFNILSLTFTNKAAREMKERIAKIVGGTEARNLWMGTFHSVFAKILRFEGDKLGYPSNFTIYDTEDSKKVLNSLIKEMQLDTDTYKAKQVQSRISQFKNNLITVKAYYNSPELQQYDAAANRPKMGELYEAYNQRCFKASAMDFDDLLLKTNELLTKFPDVLYKYQDRFRYILVDEYQDTNHSQYLIVKALASRFENICVVGDDAQSIYAFRGANIRNILNFKRDYPDAVELKLEQNYRSTKTIVNAANSIIKKNTEQLEKDVWTDNEQGPKIKVHRTGTDGEEGMYVARSIFDLKMQNQLPNSDFAVLYRTNAQSRSIEDALRKKNIPYRIYGGLSFYQRKEVKDLLSYFRLAINHNDEEAFRRTVNYPARGIGQTSIERLTVTAREQGKTLWEIIEKIPQYNTGINNAGQKKLYDFQTTIKSFSALMDSMDAYEMAAHIAKSSGLVKELRADDTPEGISRYENIQELLNGIKEFSEKQKQLDDGNPTLPHFIEDVALATDADSEDPNDRDKVSLMTIHLAKGLEFPHVFIVGMEEDLFPSQMSMTSRPDLEEERRLFYVALTRAEKSATLTYAFTRYRWGKLIDCEPSRFLEEIDDKYLDWQVPVFREFDDLPKKPTQRYQKQTQYKKPASKMPPPKNAPKKTIPTNLKKLNETPSASGNEAPNLFDGNIQAGTKVKHERFGVGVISQLEGIGANKKAIIKFDGVGEKKLLLKFAKLQVIN